MFSWLSRSAIAIALACSIGLHWPLCQAVAWANMIATYSQDASFAEAIVKTFDGKHPCALCKDISKSRQAEKKSDSNLDLKKQEFPYIASVFIFNAPAIFWEMDDGTSANSDVTHGPPVPPPRFVQA